MMISLYALNHISMFFALLPNEDYVYYILVMFIMILSYVVFHPLIVWFITLKTTKLLTYFVSSLMVLIFICMLLMVLEESRLTLFEWMKIGLHSLALFGVLLIFYNVFVSTIKKIGLKK